MHLGIYFTMTIMFSWQCLLVGLLLICSPLAPPRMQLREMVLALPVFGDAIRWTARFRLRDRRPLAEPRPVFDDDESEALAR
jgi:hypothetical protein